MERVMTLPNGTELVSPDAGRRPAQRAELSMAWHAMVPVARQRKLQGIEPLPPVEISPARVRIWTAEILGSPVRDAAIERACGRFAVVRYTPLRSVDPDIVVAFIPGAQRFHDAVLQFQRARTTSLASGWDYWYRRARDAASEALGPLASLEPAPAEADFVMGWLLQVCADGAWLSGF